MIAHLRQIRISSNKANLVAGMVRGMMVNKALDMLRFVPKKAARLVYKVIASAAANAENNFKQNRESLIIKEIIVNEGPTYKRFQPVSRGRSYPILNRTAHITVELSAAKLDQTSKSSKAKKAKHSPSASQARAKRVS